MLPSGLRDVALRGLRSCSCAAWSLPSGERNHAIMMWTCREAGVAFQKLRWGQHTAIRIGHAVLFGVKHLRTSPQHHRRAWQCDYTQHTNSLLQSAVAASARAPMPKCIRGWTGTAPMWHSSMSGRPAPGNGESSAQRGVGYRFPSACWGCSHCMDAPTSSLPLSLAHPMHACRIIVVDARSSCSPPLPTLQVHLQGAGEPPAQCSGRSRSLRGPICPAAGRPQQRACGPAGAARQPAGPCQRLPGAGAGGGPARPAQGLLDFGRRLHSVLSALVNVDRKPGLARECADADVPRRLCATLPPSWLPAGPARVPRDVPCCRPAAHHAAAARRWGGPRFALQFLQDRGLPCWQAP